MAHASTTPRPTRPARGPAPPLPPLQALQQTHHDLLQAVAGLQRLLRELAEEGETTERRADMRTLVQFIDRHGRHHHAQEERRVFPDLLILGDVDLVQHVQRLQQDHGWLEQDWLELSPVLQSIADGNQGVDVDYLREAVSVFHELYHDHLTLEESLIYPAARRRMDEADMATMGREMAERRAQARAAG